MRILFHTVKAFVELSRYLLSQPGVKFFLSEKLTQDTVECFLGGSDREVGIMIIRTCKNSYMDQTHFVYKDQVQLKCSGETLEGERSQLLWLLTTRPFPKKEDAQRSDIIIIIINVFASIIIRSYIIL